MSLVDNVTSLRVVFNSGASDCTAAAAEQVTLGWRELPADAEGCGEAAQPGGGCGSAASSGKFAASQAPHLAAEASYAPFLPPPN